MFPDFEAGLLDNTEAKIAPQLDTITGVALENRSLAASHDTLLPRPQLMSGKLLVKDPESTVSTLVSWQLQVSSKFNLNLEET